MMKLYFPEHKYTQELPPLLACHRLFMSCGKSSISRIFPKSQGRKKNGFADKRMQLLYVDSVKSSNNGKAKCLKFVVLKK